MNRKLKAKIVEKYGSQAEFAYDIKIHEAIVSRIIRKRRQLSPEQKQAWAKKLGCNVGEIF